MKKALNSKIFIFILCVIASLSVTSAFAYSLLAENVGFTPIDSQWDVDDTKEALDDLYQTMMECNNNVAGTVFNYAYSGIENTFVTPCRGNYKLEVWGAQGANYSNLHGGYGGYAKGEIHLPAKVKLFITAGGAGSNGTGGYNGGANGNNYSVTFSGGGGGASHIAFASGLLNSLSGNKDSVIIVAGGGSGSYTYSGHSWHGNNGGGYIGGYSNNSSTAGTQTAGFAFGKGGTTLSSSTNYSGGGGGYYGGYSYYGEVGAGGGSGYIGNSQLYNKYMCIYSGSTSTAENTYTKSVTAVSSTPTSDTAKTGSGYVRITYLGE